MSSSQRLPKTKQLMKDVTELLPTGYTCAYSFSLGPNNEKYAIIHDEKNNLGTISIYNPEAIDNEQDRERLLLTIFNTAEEVLNDHDIHK